MAVTARSPKVAQTVIIPWVDVIDIGGFNLAAAVKPDLALAFITSHHLHPKIIPVGRQAVVTIAGIPTHNDDLVIGLVNDD